MGKFGRDVGVSTHKRAWSIRAGVIAIVVATGLVGVASPALAAGNPQITNFSLNPSTIAVGAETTVKFTVKMSDGGKTELKAPPDMMAFDKLKVGDKIDVEYSESIVLGMLPKGTKPSVTATGAAIPGAAGQQMSVSAEIVNVDTIHNKVTFKGPKGKIKTVAVQSPDLQSRLPSLKPGDVLVFQYTEALVTAI